MIEIKLGAQSVTAKGHAGYGAHGQDIVCAGVSTLLCTAAEMLQRLEDRGEAAIREPMKLEPGDVELAFEPVGGSSAPAVLWETLAAGLELMEARYGQYVVISSGQPDE